MSSQPVILTPMNLAKFLKYMSITNSDAFNGSSLFSLSAAEAKSSKIDRPTCPSKHDTLLDPLTQTKDPIYTTKSGEFSTTGMSNLMAATANYNKHMRDLDTIDHRIVNLTFTLISEESMILIENVLGSEGLTKVAGDLPKLYDVIRSSHSLSSTNEIFDSFNNLTSSFLGEGLDFPAASSTILSAAKRFESSLQSFITDKTTPQKIVNKIQELVYLKNISRFSFMKYAILKHYDESATSTDLSSVTQMAQKAYLNDPDRFSGASAFNSVALSSNVKIVPKQKNNCSKCRKDFGAMCYTNTNILFELCPQCYREHGGKSKDHFVTVYNPPAYASGQKETSPIYVKGTPARPPSTALVPASRLPAVTQRPIAQISSKKGLKPKNKVLAHNAIFDLNGKPYMTIEDMEQLIDYHSTVVPESGLSEY